MYHCQGFGRIQDFLGNRKIQGLSSSTQGMFAHTLVFEFTMDYIMPYIIYSLEFGQLHDCKNQFLLKVSDDCILANQQVSKQTIGLNYTSKYAMHYDSNLSNSCGVATSCLQGLTCRLLTQYHSFSLMSCSQTPYLLGQNSP